ncbi:MAG TPA: class I SAM-dependent methyltransferase [Rectinemataceae bacterium]|nr:class I SAM-dependent methyltransferase [Rectinemataceae bacterium]
MSSDEDLGGASWELGLGARMRRHYERFPYPKYSLLGSIRSRDAYIFSLEALWAHFRGRRIRDPRAERVLLAGAGSFLPYPVCVANPRSRVVALDLSASSLARARLHALRHLRFNLQCVAGDLMDPALAPGPYKYIDSFGVLHCIPDFSAALAALRDRLDEGGILRVMVYSRDGRAQVEEVRSRCAERGITRPAEVRRLARGDPELRSLMRESFELGFDEGIADAFLIPYARTFVVDEVLEALAETGLELLGFGHEGALADPRRELARIRKLEAKREFPTNLCFYAGRPMEAPKPPAWIELNPLLRNAVRFTPLGSVRLPTKFGPKNPPIDAEARRFLSRFVRPVAAASLSSSERAQARAWARLLVLMEYE